MMTLSFRATKEEDALIEKIAIRAGKEVFQHTPDQTLMDTAMDVMATHSSGCPLRLQELLDADAFNFAHDIAGIRRHLNRKTGELLDCFLPRFAKPEGT
jgi:hypothetical protein